MLSVVQMQWEAQRADSTDGAGESLRAPGPRLILQGKEWVRRTADNAAPLWQGSPGSQDVPCKVGKGSTFRGTQRVSQKQSSPEGESLRTQMGTRRLVGRFFQTETATCYYCLPITKGVTHELLVTA